MKMRILAISLLFAMLIGLIPEPANGSPSTIDAEIQMNGNWEIASREGESMIVPIDGSFILTERSLVDSVTPVTATVSVSEGQWDAAPRQSIYNDVDTDNWETFTIDVEIPEDVKPGQTASYTVSIYFEAQTSDMTETAGFTINLVSGVPGDDDTTDDDDDSDGDDVNSESGGFPIWPVFLLGLIIFLVFAIIWAFRNLEIVRETDGKHRIYLREKDTGKILGRNR